MCVYLWLCSYLERNVMVKRSKDNLYGIFYTEIRMALIESTISLLKKEKTVELRLYFWKKLQFKRIDQARAFGYICKRKSNHENGKMKVKKKYTYIQF